jgi:phosphomannomutase
MQFSNRKKLQDKNLIVFDLDGTLARTKAPMDKEMSDLLTKLLTVKKVAVIGGGKYSVFQEQFIRQLKSPKPLLKHLFLFPTTSTAFYRYDKGWKNVYAHHLSEAEKNKILKAFEEVFEQTGYKHPRKVYGQIIEDRATQVTFSALGQDIVKVLGDKGIKMKEDWLKKNKAIKMKIAKLMGKKLPGMEIRAAGFTSIDVTRKGIDKAYGVKQIEKYLKIPVKKMLFIGDAIFPGGNDYAALKTGIDYVKIEGPEETKKVIRLLL